MPNLIQNRRGNPAKEYLMAYRWAMVRKEELAREIEELYEKAMQLNAKLDEAGVKGGKRKDAFAEVAVEVADKKRALETKDDDAKTMMDVLKAISSVDEQRERTVLVLRYIRGMKWEAIARKMHYDRSRVIVFHGRALEKVNRWLDDKNNGTC